MDPWIHGSAARAAARAAAGAAAGAAASAVFFVLLPLNFHDILLFAQRTLHLIIKNMVHNKRYGSMDPWICCWSCC